MEEGPKTEKDSYKNKKQNKKNKTKQKDRRGIVNSTKPRGKSNKPNR
jgi:hypothetical protein